MTALRSLLTGTALVVMVSGLASASSILCVRGAGIVTCTDSLGPTTTDLSYAVALPEWGDLGSFGISTAGETLASIGLELTAAETATTLTLTNTSAETESFGEKALSDVFLTGNSTGDTSGIRSEERRV